MPATIDLEADLLEQCNQIWEATRKARQAELNLREVPPLLRLWDGEMRLQFVVRNEDSFEGEVPENDSGPLEIRQRFDTAAGQWLWQEHQRIERGEKRNVNITIDYCGSCIGGLLEYCELDCDDEGEQVVIAHFLSDYERLKWYSVWSAPWFGEWLQWPQVYVVPGPLLWNLPLTLDFQLQRERGSTWALSSDPLDPDQRGALDQSTWSMVVKPMSFLDAMASGCLWGVALSRFKNFHEMARAMMADGEIACVIRPWLEGDPEPWPGANLRHGTRVVSFEDRSGVFTGTSHGGSIFDGLTRTVREFVEDMIDANESILTDTAIPPEYYEVGSKRSQKELPIAVWRDREITGLSGYRVRKTPAKGIQIVTGGHSMPGVNETQSALIQMAGDLTAMAIGIPPVGGAAEALLAPLFHDALFAFMVARSTARANNSGWTRYFEYFAQGAGKAYTLSSLSVLRAGIIATQSEEAGQFSAGDGLPFLIGESGHIWLSDRAGYTIRGDPTGRIYMSRITKVGLRFDRETPPEWVMTIGNGDKLKDPWERMFEGLESFGGALQQLGVV